MIIRFKNIGFGSPKQNESGKIEMNNYKPGDKIKFGLGLDIDSFDKNQKKNILAKLWTNIGNNLDPKTFYDIPMREIKPSDNHEMAFECEVPVDNLGTYKVTAMISPDEGKTWQFINDYGIKDLIFKPKIAEWDSLNIREVNIGKANAKEDSQNFSTIEDMLDSTYGKYNLESLKSQGVNAIWIQCPFRADVWDKRHPFDTAGSPYAVTDYFSIDPRLSSEAMKVDIKDIDRQRELANQAMEKLIEKAHKMNIKIFFCIAPNHVGHNYIFRDLIKDKEGNLKVVRNDYSNIASSKEELLLIENKINNKEENLYAEYINPKMYATLKNNHYDPHGALSVNETMHDTWYGDWSDTKKLNHGAFAAFNIHEASTIENQKVLDYLERIMFHAAKFFGVDGFRIDHTTGLPDQFFFETLPKLQAKMDRPLFIMAEDHDRKTWTAQVSDLVQSKWYEQIIDHMNHENVDGFFQVTKNPYFQELVQTGNHDEQRAINAFCQDIRAYGRYVCTMELFGKAFSMLMGDEYAESKKLNFLSYGGVPTLEQAFEHKLLDPNKELSYFISKAGNLKISHESLKSGITNRLYLKEDKKLPILAFSRHPYEGNSSPVLVFSNLSNKYNNGGFYELDDKTRTFIKEILEKNPKALFQVRDMMGEDPNKLLWESPKNAQELLEKGLCALLRPYQVQALEFLVC